MFLEWKLYVVESLFSEMKKAFVDHKLKTMDGLIGLLRNILALNITSFPKPYGVVVQDDSVGIIFHRINRLITIYYSLEHDTLSVDFGYIGSHEVVRSSSGLKVHELEMELKNADQWYDANRTKPNSRTTFKASSSK